MSDWTRDADLMRTADGFWFHPSLLLDRDGEFVRATSTRVLVKGVPLVWTFDARSEWGVAALAGGVR